MQRRGFTIVELLIVVVVIGILAAVSIVAYGNVQQRAKVSRANADLAALNKAIQTARVNQVRTLMQITGSNCSHCIGFATTNASIDAIAAASGTNLSRLKQGDPWGNIYRIDENEGENGNCNPDGLGVSPGQTGVSVILVPTFAC
ncbi:MAG: prepilin-type N-terminal cleavage/methylation domain-containing protein [Candidatus Saccharimonadales bacterium]